MADLLNEQEQVDAIKAWWKQYGNAVLVGIVVVLLAMTGWRFWQAHQQKVAFAQAMAYETLLGDVGKNPAAVNADAATLIRDYPHSTYAALAAFFLAQQAVENNQLPAAEAQLTWVTQNTHDKPTIMIAKMRLARVLLAEHQPGQALKTLTGVQNALADSIRGDAYAALNNPTAAKAAYQQALQPLSPSDPLYATVQMKQYGLGATS